MSKEAAEWIFTIVFLLIVVVWFILTRHRKNELESMKRYKDMYSNEPMEVVLLRGRLSQLQNENRILAEKIEFLKNQNS